MKLLTWFAKFFMARKWLLNSRNDQFRATYMYAEWN